MFPTKSNIIVTDTMNCEIVNGDNSISNDDEI